jgi:protein-S-isoprenylcysteine O-methyltransferase Ste14
MRASTVEFRMRGLILTLIVVLGFWAPWLQALDLGKRVSLLEWFALQLSRSGLLRFMVATPVVIAVGAILAFLGVVLRVWGTAYLGPGIVNSRQLKAGSLLADGPYRYVRNPLYLGTWFMLAAMSFLMTPTGALFAIVLITFFLLRLILAEEWWLAGRIGQPYRDYTRAVPRIIPRLRTNVPSSESRTNWFAAFISELNALSVFITLAVLSWTYDHELMIKAIVIGFGISLIARALLPGNLKSSPSRSSAA